MHRRGREDGGSTLERAAAGEELVHDDAEGELIGAEVHLFARRLLRRHGTGRAHDQPGVGAERGPLPVVFHHRQLGQAEVQHLQVAVGPDHDVLGLDVAVHDAAPMRGRERAGHLRADIDRFTDGDGLTVHLLAERLPRHELGDDERTAVDLADVVDHEDVGMVERRGRSRLDVKAAEALGIARHRGRQELDRHQTIEPGVARAIHLAHAAGTDLRLDEIAAERAADRIIEGILGFHQGVGAILFIF